MILSLVEKHIALTKKGSHYVGACPLCGGGKKADAFTVDVTKDFVQCYACSVNMGPVSAVPRKCYKLGALKMLL